MPIFVNKMEIENFKSDDHDNLILGNFLALHRVTKWDEQWNRCLNTM